MAKGWSLDDIDWSRFDPEKVDPVLVKLTKAAAMVEYNGSTYTAYLKRVFNDDPAFQEKAEQWGSEEVLHGEALAAWAKKADPDFDFTGSFKRFTDGYSVPTDVDASVRGSRSAELIARCIVETGTSSFYTALSRASEEPVLADIARRIAADEFRHYKMFYDALHDYMDVEGVGRLGRMRAALGRIGELEDDELAYAYYAANWPEDAAYDREACIGEYMGRVYRHIDQETLRRGNSLILKAVGLTPNGMLNKVITAGAHRYVSYRAQKLAPAA